MILLQSTRTRSLAFVHSFRHSTRSVRIFSFSNGSRDPRRSKDNTLGENNVGMDEKNATRLAQKLSVTERRLLMKALTEIDASGSTDRPPPPPVTSSALYHLAFHQSLPFIGFGFLDNLIMILAGEYIDHTLGLALGISTMAAAAIGNTISDVFGVGSAWYVEHWVLRLGASPPPLSLEQLELPECRLSSSVGRAAGIVVGCIVGMAPLAFY